MGYFNCIDVSEWNGDIDWHQARADGVEYAIIRCGFGKAGVDKYFEINMEGAHDAGVKIGVYFYSYATDWDTAVMEANHCIELIEGYKDIIALPVFYDVEEERNVPRMTDICMAFINTLNYYGYNVGVYTSGSWYSAYFKNIDVDFIWLAYWGRDDGVPHTKPDYCDIWQYTSRGSVDGVGSRCVDCDILYNTEMKLLIKDSDPEPEPAPQPAPPPVETVDITLNVLRKGDTGGQVNTVKALLNEFGFRDNNGDELELDGEFDDLTEYTVRNYQDHHGLKITGTVNAETWRLLLL